MANEMLSLCSKKPESGVYPSIQAGGECQFAVPEKAQIGKKWFILKVHYIFRVPIS